MRTPEQCPCGSGREPWVLDDARGIFIAYVCENCEDDWRKKYRPEIFDNPRYDADEQIEPDEDDTPPDGPWAVRCPGHDWVYTGTAYGGDDESYSGEGRVYCANCGADGDA